MPTREAGSGAESGAVSAIGIFIDLTLAVLTLIAAPVAGWKASRRWLSVLAALGAGRLIVFLLLLTAGPQLADARLIMQAPLAVLPAAWAVWRPGRTAAHVAAAGAMLSVWWLLLPFGPGEYVLVLAGSAVALALLGALSAAVGRWRAAGSRLSALPWTAGAFLLVPALSLTVAGAANASTDEHEHPVTGQLSVAQLTGPREGAPDARFTLTAARGEIRLDSGRTVQGLTFNSRSPGPELRVQRGDLVEVTLVNTDVTEGVTLHWHGVDVPNAEDGVPGVTQDAVLPGGRHVYRFVPPHTGSFWYHTHRDGALNVKRGLFGAFIVEDDAESDLDRTLFAHAWPAGDQDIVALDRADRPGRQDAEAGSTVRLRTVNSSEEPQQLVVGGTPFTVAALDGNTIQGATPLEPGTGLLLPAGGRYDLTFTMPAGPVTVGLAGTPDAALTLSPGGTATGALPGIAETFDPLSYGSGTAPAGGGHQRTYDLRLDDGFGFSQGRLNYVSSLINGRLYPAVPSLEVSRGELVKVRIANRGIVNHPVHLHGHRVRVLTRNGEPATGSPWWTDTLNVASGELYELEFLATNPGIWMDHCHNFEHGASGMIMHVVYTGVGSPYSSDHAPE